MKKLMAVLTLGGLLTMASHAEAGLRRFYWTSESQSYSYDFGQAKQECFIQAEAAAYPYAYNTCVQKIGGYSCQNSRTYTEYLQFGGYPGLFNCQVRVWVEAFE